VNSDSSGKGILSVGGSPTLEGFLREVVRDVKDPVSGKSLLEDYLAKSAKSTPGNTPGKTAEIHLAPLGSGSDYTPFLQHLGIASLNLGFETQAGGGVYHSAYDNFYWYSHFEDTDFVYGRTLAQMNATVAMRLADAPLLPFDFSQLAAAVGTYLDEITLPAIKPAALADLGLVRKANARLALASISLNRGLGAAVSQNNLAAVNRLLIDGERDLTLDPGLPGRPWYRHRIYAPGRYTGYAVKTLPGVREALEADRADEAAGQTKQVAQVLQTLAAHVEAAAKLAAKPIAQPMEKR
jgi:N-acetylated-alpha-linked acidic dipeptidase